MVRNRSSAGRADARGISKRPTPPRSRPAWRIAVMVHPWLRSRSTVAATGADRRCRTSGIGKRNWIALRFSSKTAWCPCNQPYRLHKIQYTPVIGVSASEFSGNLNQFNSLSVSLRSIPSIVVMCDLQC